MGQETDAFKAMMEQEKDTFRQPTEAEFGEAYPAAFPGMQRSSITPSPSMAAAEYTGPQQVTPPDSALMGMGGMPGIIDKLQRQNAGLTGNWLDDQIGRASVDLQANNFTKEMERLRGGIQPTQAFTPTPMEPERIEKRDYAQLLQDYKGDETKQIMLDKKPRMEWMMQNLQNMEGMESNPFARRMLMQLMMSNIDRGEEERLYQRGAKATTTAADTAFGRAKELKQMEIEAKDTRTPNQKDFDRAQRDPAFQTWKEKFASTKRPAAAIQYWNQRQKMIENNASKDDIARFDSYVRAAKVFDTGAGFQIRSGVFPQGSTPTIIPKELPLEKRPEYLGEAEQVKAERKVEGEKIAEARWDAPQAKRETTSMLALLDQIYKLDSKGKLTYTHPGFEGVVGATWLPGMRFLHGTQEYAMDKLINQVKDKNFLSAFESLKGGGHITEIEGEKATDSIAAIHIGMPEEDFIIEMEKVRTVLLNGLAIAQEKMQGTMGPRSGRTGDTAGRSNADMVWDPVTKKLIPNRRQ
jgi:hypothetical protein